MGITELDTPCIEWQGFKNKAGYGQRTVNYKRWLAHRYAWFQEFGEIPEGMVIMHRCDNPACIRVSHLQLGTHGDNVRDKEAKGRGNAGEANAHAKLSDEQVREIRRLYEEGYTQSHLGRIYGVNRSCIWKIVNNTHRRNIL